MKYLLLGLSVYLFGMPLNFPHRADDFGSNTYYVASSGSPKTLDPAKSYTAEGAVILGQVAAPPLTYSYFKRPYQLEPLAASVMPIITYYDQSGHKISAHDISKIAETHYDILLRSDLVYGPHKAFGGQKRFANAEDFVYAIKRLASPKVNSPIYSVMAAHIKGFTEFNQHLRSELQLHRELSNSFWDLRPYSLSGVLVIGPNHFRIVTKGFYRPFIYWLTMGFFAPMPYEVDRYYSDSSLPSGEGHDWYPVGTGPYMLVENDPNSRIVLSENPNFHLDFFPSSGDPADISAGYTKLSGQRLPLVSRLVFNLEKETVSSWNKFLQGYYDVSGVNSDNFDQVISMGADGSANLSADMQARGISLHVSDSPTVFFMGFNMLDSVVGGESESARLLRHAISIAIDQEEYIAIFMNGRGVVAHSPIPRGIFGGDGLVNTYVYADGHRRSLREAKALLAEAGYAGGIDPKTKRPLVLRLDTISGGGADAKSRFNWYRSQFKKLGIILDIEATQYNRFQEKMRNGQAQIFNWGWSADYPDPENFLFLLYGPNGKVKHHGENATNYLNSEYDRCFESMRDLANTPERAAIVKRCIQILQYDAPMVFGVFPRSIALKHGWQEPLKLNSMAHNTFKYISIDPKRRLVAQLSWNQQSNSILGLLLVFFACLVGLMVYAYKRKNRIKLPKNE